MANRGKTLMLAVGAWLGVGTASSCTHKDEASKPAGISAMAAPAAPAAPIAPAEPAPAAAPAAPPSAGSDETAALEAPPDPHASIRGTIVLAPARRAAVAPNDVVFLVARRLADNPQARGTLVAVKRFTAASFPIPFSLSASDMMVPTGSFAGVVSLTARVDKDGDPMTHLKGDVLGVLPKVAVGASGVKLTLDQVQKEDESLAGSGPMMGLGSGAGAGQMANPHAGLPPGHP